MIDEALAQSVARSIAESTLGHDPGSMTRVESKSHYVFVGDEAVVKLIGADNHARLDREITLALDLPAGLSASVLAHGRMATDAGDLRYACIARRQGASPGMGLERVDRATALRWARQAVRQLQRLHAWTPGPAATATLREELEHGGFVTQSAFIDLIERVRSASSELSRTVLDGLLAIANRAPNRADASVPVHADCHWGNWLVDHDRVSVLLDFEWARFGEPVDDWMFLARFSGLHMHAVLAVIAELTQTSLDSLRAACELREASYLTSDLLTAVLAENEDEVRHTVRLLNRVVNERLWWTP